MPAIDSATIVQTVHGAMLALCVPAYFTNFFKLEGTTGDLGQIDSILGTISLEIHGELKDRITPLFLQDTKVIVVSDNAYSEKSGNVVESEAFKEAVRTFAGTHSGHLFDYGRVLSLREAVVFWRRCLAWCVLALVVWELFALTAVVLLPRFFPSMVDEIYVSSLVPLIILVLVALFSMVLLRIKNDCLAKIRTRLTSLSK